MAPVRQNGASTWTVKDNCSIRQFQPVYSFQQLLTILPSNGGSDNAISLSAGTAVKFLRPKTIRSPHSAVIEILKAYAEGKDASSYCMNQLLEEAIDLANAFLRGDITLNQFTDTNYVFQNDVTSPGKTKRESGSAMANKRRNMTKYPSFI